MVVEQRLRRTVDKALAEHRAAAAAVTSEREALKRAAAALALARGSRDVIQAATQAVQVTAHEQISKIVTRCIRTVGWDYDFQIRFDRKRGKTEAKFLFLRDGHPVDPTGAAGGGVVDVAALGVRVVCLILATPKRRRYLQLDEPFKGVNGVEYRRRAAELVMLLAKEMNVQIVLATGLEWLRIGKEIEL